MLVIQENSFINLSKEYFYKACSSWTFKKREIEFLNLDFRTPTPVHINKPFDLHSKKIQVIII